MNDIERERYLLHGTLPAFRRRVDQARRLVEQSFETANRWYIACSFGKDSIVLQHIVRQVVPDVHVVFIVAQEGTTCLPEDFAMIQEYAAQQIINLTILKWSKSEYYASLGEQDAKHMQSFRHDAWLATLAQWLNDNPHDGVFLGLRKAESVIRMFSIGKHGPLHQYETGFQAGYWRCTPLYSWSIDDIGAYIASNNLPLLDIYKKMGLEARSGLFGFTNANMGRLAYLRRYYPDVFERFAQQYPEARNYT